MLDYRRVELKDDCRDRAPSRSERAASVGYRNVTFRSERAGLPDNRGQDRPSGGAADGEPGPVEGHDAGSAMGRPAVLVTWMDKEGPGADPIGLAMTNETLLLVKVL